MSVDLICDLIEKQQRKKTQDKTIIKRNQKPGLILNDLRKKLS